MQKKSKLLLQTLSLFLFPLLLLAVGLPLCCRDRGFSIEKISSQLDYREEWEIDSLSQEEEETLVQNIFSQPFYYLAAGQQCYAFVSQDQQYVLKFFKMHHLMPQNWLNDFPFSLFENYRFNHVDKKQQFLEITFHSFKTAYDHLKKETGLIYLHLNKTHYLKKKITIIDRSGKKTDIDLDTIEFALQRKAQNLYPHLLDLMRNHADQRAHKCLRSLLNLIVSRCHSGLADQDTGVRHHYGFIGDEAILIDCGQLVPDESLPFPHNYQREILRIAQTMDQWAQRNCPELIPIIQEEAQRLINEPL